MRRFYARDGISPERGIGLKSHWGHQVALKSGHAATFFASAGRTPPRKAHAAPDSDGRSRSYYFPGFGVEVGAGVDVGVEVGFVLGPGWYP
jgi:hypothetical protein